MAKAPSRGGEGREGTGAKPSHSNSTRATGKGKQRLQSRDEKRRGSKGHEGDEGTDGDGGSEDQYRLHLPDDEDEDEYDDDDEEEERKVDPTKSGGEGPSSSGKHKSDKHRQPPLKRVKVGARASIACATCRYVLHLSLALGPSYSAGGST